MSQTCDYDCNNCEQKCDSPVDLKAPCNKNSEIRHVFAVVSGKGGVGKSLITSLLAVISNKNHYKTAILDADITGPSIPKVFNIKEKAYGSQEELFPNESENGIKIMSANLLLDDDSDPVIMRGPLIAGMVKQFYSDVHWGKIDHLFVDCPPGTGDVPLTIFQSLPVEGIIIVTSPQDLVSMIVKKAVNMAKMMNIKVLGIVENMAYFECPNCHEKHFIYGPSNIDRLAKEYQIDCVVQLPIQESLAKLSDDGKIEDVFEENLIPLFQHLIEENNSK